MAIPTAVNEGVNAKAVGQDHKDRRASGVSCTRPYSPLGVLSSIVPEQAETVVIRQMDPEYITPSMLSEDEYYCNTSTQKTAIPQTVSSGGMYYCEERDKCVAERQTTSNALDTRTEHVMIGNEYANHFRTTVDGDEDMSNVVNNSPTAVCQRIRKGESLLYTTVTLDGTHTSGKHTDEVGYESSPPGDTGDTYTGDSDTDIGDRDACTGDMDIGTGDTCIGDRGTGTCDRDTGTGDRDTGDRDTTGDSDTDTGDSDTDTGDTDKGDSDTDAYMIDTADPDERITVCDEEGRRNTYWFRHGEEQADLHVPITGTKLKDASHTTNDRNSINYTLESTDRRKRVDIIKDQLKYNRVAMPDMPNTIIDKEDEPILTVDKVERQYLTTTNADLHATSSLADYADIVEPNLEMECETREMESDSEGNSEPRDEAATPTPSECLQMDHPYMLAPQSSLEQPCKRTLKCHHCGIVFSNSRQHTTHLRTHFTQNMFHCDICCESRANTTNPGAHKSRDDVGNQICKRCGKVLVNGPPKLTCNRCGVTYRSISRFPMHRCNQKIKVGKVHRACRRKCKVANVNGKTRSNYDTQFKCEACGKIFATPHLLKMHSFIHTNEKRCKCHVCGKVVSNKRNLRLHLMIHDGRRDYTCDICHKRFRLLGGLKQHIISHVGLRSFPCDTCGKTFLTQTALSRHKISHSSVKKYQCDQCGAAFGRLDGLKIHVLIIHDAVKKFICEYCQRAFSTKREMIVHTRKHTGDRPLSCEYCEKSFSNKMSLTVHTNIHTRARHFLCNICNKTFSSKSCLCIHQRTHAGERPYRCTQCNKAFTAKGNLINHVRMHTGESPHQCTQCSKAFSTSGCLVIHKRTHTGERPYQCTQCSKAFSTKHYLYVHKRTHTEVKPYQCAHCKKSFSTKTYFRIHKRIHTGEKPYHCTHCSKAFSTRYKLVVHKKVHTG